jgi:hypothetical protein
VTPAEIQAFRDRIRLSLIERIALRTAFLVPLSTHQLSIEESRKALVDWLDLNSAIADRALGEKFRDPAVTALYAEEVRELTDKMKSIVDELAKEAKDVFDRHG